MDINIALPLDLPQGKSETHPSLPLSCLSFSRSVRPSIHLVYKTKQIPIFIFGSFFFSTTSYFVLFDEKMSTGELLSIEPLELKFPCKSPMHGFLHSLLHLSLFLLLSFMYFVFGLVELKKQISCSLQLSNYLLGCAFCDKTS